MTSFFSNLSSRINGGDAEESKADDLEMQTSGNTLSKRSWQKQNTSSSQETGYTSILDQLRGNKSEEQEEEVKEGRTGRAAGLWNKISQKMSDAKSSVSDAANSAAEQAENYKYFVVLFLVGCGFIALSLFFLPFIVVAPRKTANLFNAGSLCILASFAIVRGTYKFVVEEMLCNPYKAFVAWLYLLSLLTCFYASLIAQSYILTIAALVIELICLLYFICSFFPYGKQGFDYMMKCVCTTLKSAFGC